MPVMTTIEYDSFKLKEPGLGDPVTDDYVLSSKTDGTRSWIVGGSSPDASETVKGIAELATQAEVNAGTDTSRIVTPVNLKTELNKQELSLGNPGTDGYVLSSTITGVRSWIASVAVIVVDALTSTSTTSALSANQGKVLNDTKIAAVDYATSTVGGTLKARLSGTDLYLTNNGVNP